MDRFVRKAMKYSFVVFGILWGLLFIAGTVHAQTQRAAGNQLPVETNISQSVAVPDAVKPPASEMDQCLHCHIGGSDENLWTPFFRWSLFGLVGAVFLFGMVRSTWVWRNRTKWVPLTTRAGDWFNERYQIKEMMEKILKKPVPLWATRWWYCLGGLTAFLFVIQGITGVMLAFYYQPTPDQAYASIQFIESEVRFGASVRMIHHWSANGMIIMVFAHMLRVFIMGAFRKPRELNWVSGVVLFLTTLLFGFTGYLLPWDQRAYWATTVGSEIAGGIPSIGNLILIFLRVGWDISSTTLSRFYALHILVAPVVIIVMMLLHFMMVRRQGVQEPL